MDIVPSGNLPVTQTLCFPDSPLIKLTSNISGICMRGNFGGDGGDIGLFASITPVNSCLNPTTIVPLGVSLIWSHMKACCNFIV